MHALAQMSGLVATLLIATPFIIWILVHLTIALSSVLWKGCEKGKGDDIGTPDEIADSPCSGANCTRVDCRRRRWVVAHAGHAKTS